MNPSNPSKEALSAENRVNGVFSSTKIIRIGTGNTQKTVTQQVLVYAEEDDEGWITITPLNQNYVPSGKSRVINMESLLKNFLPEPEIYMTKALPAIQQLKKTIARGERHLRNNETFSAEMEFKGALRIDEKSIRATFGLGLSYLQRGEARSGEIVFKRLVKLKGAFETQHKHMFNEFGIHLRKNKMFTHALKYYARASKYSDQDENLFFNMARTYHEAGNLNLALRMVRKALSINPNFSKAAIFRDYLEKDKFSKPFKA